MILVNDTRDDLVILVNVQEHVIRAIQAAEQARNSAEHAQTATHTTRVISLDSSAGQTYVNFIFPVHGFRMY